jgi:gas vesicle protein
MEDTIMNDTQYDRGMSNTGSTLLGFAIGAVVGAGIALLLAPESGKRTRDRLASKARSWSRNAGDTLEQARDTVADLGTDAKAAIKAGQDSFKQDRASREPSGERRTVGAGEGQAVRAANNKGEEVSR